MHAKIVKIFENILRSTLIIAMALSIYRQSWSALLVSFVTLVLTFLPDWIESRYKIILPHDFALTIVLFIYGSLFLGGIHQFYERFWWWDIMLHSGSAIGFGCIGFIIMYMLNKSNKIETKPFWIALFGFCFAIAIGTLWEIYEFAVDQLFGMNMQRSGLIDTMWDLIVDSLGALIAALAGYAFIKGDQRSYLSRLIGLFIKDNPKLNL